MKRVISVLIVTAMVLSFSGAAFSEGEPGPIEKLTRGVTNVVTSPGEMLDSVMDDRAGVGMAAGKSHGLVEGVSRFFVKAIAGLMEIATFPFPWPNEYKPILDDTEGFKTKKPSQ
jgi:putative exosortase-associated protein (TIGR04073 family)